ncbi:unnamed protein product [Spirodela intermedia]|uniref:Uncharacterized protein n=1 Tax=Spirodela intermedia TaxID=51605 RepID=A0A7I8K3F6_SPIIN|nr:unnamed protein product [Spirodela intermedia]
MGQGLLCLALSPIQLGLLADIVEQRRLRRQWKPPVSPRHHDDGEDLGQRASDQLLEAISASTGEEHEQPDQDGGGAYAVAPPPTQVVLDVDEDRHRDQGAEADEEEEIVEEFHHPVLLPRVRLVELV